MQRKVQDFPLVEISRGILATLVFLGHLPLANSVIMDGESFWPPDAEFRWLNYWAAIGIDIFLFISGFLFSGKLDTVESPVGFLTRRLNRVYPTLLIVVIVLSCIYIDDFAKVINLLIYLFYPVPLSDDKELILFGHLWSLRLELYLYVLIFVLKYLKKYRLILFLIAAMLLSMASISFVFIIAGFLLGRSTFRLKAEFWGFLMCLIFFLYLNFGFNVLTMGFVGKVIRLIVTSLLGLTLFSYSKNRVNRSLKYLSTKIGFWSYSAYLVNGVALYMGLKLLILFKMKLGFVTVILILFLWVTLSLITYFTFEKSATKIFNNNSN